MNQDQVKTALLQLRSDIPDFTVIFSGKQSKRVDGLYKPESKEIIIHNKNMPDDHGIMYTAIHEFAHHVHFSTQAVPVSARAHTNAFWNIFHELLAEAENREIWMNKFDTIPAFRELTRRIKTDFLEPDGRHMQAFGKVLLEAMQLCREHRLSFEDYVDRTLGMHRHTAKAIMQVYEADPPPAYGFENMKLLTRIKEPERRRQAVEAMEKGGVSPDMIKHRFLPTASTDPEKKDPVAVLEKEKERIEHTIHTLNSKLRKIEERIDNLKSDAGGADAD